jgi:hypothetical protein
MRLGDRRGRDRILVGFTHNVIKFVSNLQRVGGFLRVVRFPPAIKLTTTI